MPALFTPMAHNPNYKKIFVLAAALFLIFAPVGVTVGGSNNKPLTATPTVALSQSHSFHFVFNLNLADAATTTSGAQYGIGSATTNSIDPLSCLTSPATCGVFLVSMVVNGAFGLLLTGGAWLVRLGLQFNDNVFNSPAIQTGFSVSLAIANLGFVLGIIIIAIATIVRNQTYGIKQLLWKLVFMAILVNFGLVITAPIVGFANNMSTYFINATSPSAATGGYEAYVTTMESAFGTQTITLSTPTTVSSLCQSWLTYLPGPWAMCHIAGQSTQTMQNTPDAFWQNTMALLFDIAFSAIAAFTFICLAILLLIRYLMLGGLLIVLPLAWLTYIFPKFDNSYSKWWNTFIKWTFFPPLALFFIYLAFITAANLGNTTPQGQAAIAYQTAAIGSSSTTIESGLSKQTGQNGSVIGQAADEILLVGLMIMGLMFALSLSGKAGSTVVHGAETVSKAVGGYVGRKGKRVVGDRLRTAGQKYNPETKETTSALQRFGSRLQGLPIVGALGGKAAGAALANYTAPKAVSAERKAEIEEYTKKNLTNIDSKGLLALANSKTATVNPTQAAAIAQELAKRDLISKLDDKTQKKYLHYAESMGTAEAVYNNRPDLVEPRMIPANPATGAPARMETKEEAIARAVGNAKGEIINVNSEVFNYTDPATAATKLGLKDPTGAPLSAVQTKEIIQSAILKLTPAQLGALGSDQSSGSQARQNNLTESVKEILRTIPGIKKAVLNPVTGAPTGKYELDNVALQAHITAQKLAGVPKNKLDGLANIERIVKHMESSPNWGSVLN